MKKRGYKNAHWRSKGSAMKNFVKGARRAKKRFKKRR